MKGVLIQNFLKGNPMDLKIKNWTSDSMGNSPSFLIKKDAQDL